MTTSEIRVLDAVWVRRVTIEIDGHRHELVLGPGESWRCDIRLLERVGHEGLEKVHRACLEALRTA